MSAAGTEAPRVAPIELAVIHGKMGYRIFPLRPQDKRPAITDWQKRASSDEEGIRRMPWRDDSNIGILTGTYPGSEVCLAALDLDDAKGRPGFTGQQVPLASSKSGQVINTIREAVRNDPFLDGCRIHQTASGGLHLLLLSDSRVASQTDLFKSKQTEGWALDVKAEGGYIVAPGSVLNTDSGLQPYVAVEGGHLHLNQLPRFGLEWFKDNVTTLKLYQEQRNDRGSRVQSRERAARNAGAPIDIGELRDALFFIIDHTPEPERQTFEWWRDNILLPLSFEAACDPRPPHEGEILYRDLFDAASGRCGGETKKNHEEWQNALARAERILDDE